jgi:N-acetylmuramoyl-L-alanine amidase
MHRSILPAAALLAACASGPRGTSAPVPLSAEPDASARVRMPPVPRVAGPVKIAVIYPRAGATIASRDSNFIFGSVGNGAATLTINGASVPVLPNGSFLAYLPLPPASDPRYELVARAGADSALATVPVGLLPPRTPLPLEGTLVVDSASAAPRVALALRDDEPVRVSVRAPANASVWVVTAARPDLEAAGSGRPGSGGPAPGPDSARIAAPRPDSAAGRPPHRDDRSSAARSGNRSMRRDTIPARRASAVPVATASVEPPPPIPLVRATPTSELWATEIPAGRLRGGAAIVAARGTDTVRLAIPRVAPVAELGAATLYPVQTTATSDTDRVVIGRPTPGGTYKWFFLPGTVLPVTGQSGEWRRVRLDEALEVWVAAAEAAPQPAGLPLPTRVAGNARVLPAEKWVDVAIPTGDRPPYFVQEEGQALQLTLYGTTANTDLVQLRGNDPLVRDVTWVQESAGRARYTVHLAQAPYGYQVLWNGSALVLRVRRTPAVHRRAPLSGLTIAVDPGHPPIGATGPTGLYEAVPALAVGRRVQALLAERGAKVVMTRTTDDPVALGDRPIIARRADAHALVSIHLNALPDGINPFGAHGTGTYYFHPHSTPLARAVQRGMVRRMGLRDLGVYYDNLALVRPTWMPSVLCEGAFIMLPEQEAALRTPEFQEAYARGIVEGLERYFAELGSRR